jgi:hypothetical protein
LLFSLTNVLRDELFILQNKKTRDIKMSWVRLSLEWSREIYWGSKRKENYERNNLISLERLYRFVSRFSYSLIPIRNSSAIAFVSMNNPYTFSLWLELKLTTLNRMEKQNGNTDSCHISYQILSKVQNLNNCFIFASQNLRSRHSLLW